MSEWVKCSERMPDTGVGVLITNGKIVTAAQFEPMTIGPNKVVPSWTGHELSGYEWDWDFDVKSITHWMPLPSPPDQPS